MKWQDQTRTGVARVGKWKLIAALLLAPSNVCAGPCEDVEAFLQAQKALQAAQQKISALERTRPQSAWAGLQQQLQKAQESARQARQKHDKALSDKKKNDEQWQALSLISGWLLSADGTAQEAANLQTAQRAALPANINAQFRRLQRLRTEIADLEQEIKQAQAALNTANKVKRQEIITYRQEQITPLEASIRSRMPGVPLDKLDDKAEDDAYKGFTNPKIEKLWADLRAAEAQQVRFESVDEAHRKTIQAINRNLSQAIEECREAVLDDLDTLEDRRVKLLSMEQGVYGGEAARRQVQALPANRERKAKAETELAGLENQVLSQNKAALKKMTAENIEVLQLRKVWQDAQKRVAGLEGDLKSWREAQQAKTTAEQQVEERRAAFESARRGQTAALARAVSIIRQPLGDYKDNSPTAYDNELQQLRERNRTMVAQARTTRDRLQAYIDELKRRRIYTEQQKSRIFGEWGRYLAAVKKQDQLDKARYAEIMALQKQPDAQRRRQWELLGALQKAQKDLAPFDCRAFPDAQRSLKTIEERTRELREKMRNATPANAPAGVARISGFLVLPDLYSPATDDIQTTQRPPTPPSSPAKGRTIYRLVKTKLSSQVPNKPVEEKEVAGFQATHVVTVQEPTYNSTTTVTVKAPTQIQGDDEFEIDAKLSAQWSLKNPTYNLNAGLGVAGSPKGKALEGQLNAGGHTLNLDNAQKRTFRIADGFLRKWKENGVVYRSFTVGFHSGVVQSLCGGNMTFIYRAEK